MDRYSLISEDKTYIPDTSVIINGELKTFIETIETNSKFIIHASLIAELEHLANLGKKNGTKGLKELTHIRSLCDDLNIHLSYGGRRPRLSEVMRAGSGEIDAIIRDFTWKNNGILITSDKIQHLSAKSVGIETIYLKAQFTKVEKSLRINAYFDSETMSIHLKQGAPVYVKRGTPGNVRFEQYSDEICTKDHLMDLAEEIIEKAQLFEDTFIEIDRKATTIVQYEDIRIVICKPPFSDGWEITAVRPLSKLSIDDYNLSSSLFQRLREKAEGILIAGSPGAGKTTFVRALALFYEKQSKIIKTIESPRDLVLKAEITQYSKNFGTHSEILDILLLSRPDYTIFDEIRDTEDFKLYTDLRLAGIGLVGVIHSSTAIDAIQRFIGRLELGVIPSVLDTIIYIKDGEISQVLDVRMIVKVPAGLIESDLARPVIEVIDFETGEAVYEMYTFGDQTVVIPLKENSLTRVKINASTIQVITKAIEQFTTKPIVLIPKDRYGKRYDIDCVPKDIPLILGRGGENIKMLEKSFQVKLDINRSGTRSQLNRFNILNPQMISIRKNTLFISLPRRVKNKNVQFFMEDELLEKNEPFFIGTTSRSGKIKLSLRSEIGRSLVEKLEFSQKKIIWKEK
ncbi:MAG: ATPase, T2SS/T4P/T4SS family [Candidatus Hodarchaeales archaeon]|jgi:ATPase